MALFDGLPYNIRGHCTYLLFFSSPLRTRKNNGYATRTLWALFLCVKLIVYFLVFVLCCFEHFFFNWSCIFTSSEHRDAPMVWNLRQTIFCFDGHMSINIYRWLIYLWLFLPVLMSNWNTRNRNRGSEVCWKGLAAHSAEVCAWCSDEKTGIQVKVTAIHSKVSLISVLAPSPDWFVAVDSHDFCENGRWREAWHVITLLPYDSGTDSGSQFIGRDQETVPPMPIFRINNTMNGVFKANESIKSLGEFRFKLQVEMENSASKDRVNLLVIVIVASILAFLFLGIKLFKFFSAS